MGWGNTPELVKSPLVHHPALGKRRAEGGQGAAVERDDQPLSQTAAAMSGRPGRPPCLPQRHGDEEPTSDVQPHPERA